MKMRVAIIDTLAKVLSGVKINKIEDGGAKAALLKDYLALRKIARDAESDKGEIVRKFQQDWSEELGAVDALRKSGREVVGHDAYLSAERDANGAISGIYEADAEVVLEAVPSDVFYNPDLWGSDVTLEQIPGTVEFLEAHGVAEGKIN